MEKKYLNFTFKIKDIKEDDPDNFIFTGYASTFGNIDRGDDTVVKGAFEESIKEMIPKLLWQHDRHEPLGIFTQIYEDEIGLYVEGKMPKDDSLVRDRVMPQMKIGSINSMSIGFSVLLDEYDRETEIRKLLKIKLWEISLVTLPMDPKAIITNIKSLQGINDIPAHFSTFTCQKDISSFLKDLGLNDKESTSLISTFKRVNRNEIQSRNEKECLDNIAKSMLELTKETKEKFHVN